MPKKKQQTAMEDPDLGGQIKYLMIKQAAAVLNESVTTLNHEKRVQLAKAVLTSNVSWEMCKNLVIADSSIESLSDITTASDAQITLAIQNFWDTLSLIV